MRLGDKKIDLCGQEIVVSSRLQADGLSPVGQMSTTHLSLEFASAERPVLWSSKKMLRRKRIGLYLPIITIVFATIVHAPPVLAGTFSLIRKPKRRNWYSRSVHVNS